jgi:cytochrome c peroxidase
LVDKLNGLSDYQGLFETAFGRRANMETIGLALASYQRTLVSGASRFDRWYFGKEASALNREEQRGYALFSGKANCVACHTIGRESALFTDQKFHSTGLGWQNAMQAPAAVKRVPLAPGVTIAMDRARIDVVAEAPRNDLGRYEVTQDPADRWTYKTPTLRNIVLTAPYMHDGSLATLEAVVDLYDRGGVAAAPVDPLIKPLKLNDAEKADLVAFLKSLTGDNVADLVNDAFAAPIGDPAAESH